MIENQRIVLASRPAGAPTAENFRLESVPVPPVGDGQLLIRTLYLSLDPYMRLRMNEGESYADPVGIGEVMFGGTIGRVLESRHPQFQAGDLVAGYTGWQSHAISDGSMLSRLAPDMANPSWALGVLGMPGFTAWYGLLHLGEPKEGDTVVVAAATGAVGAVVGQIAKLRKCRVVGIAGGAEKCRYAVESLGFDACIDHRADDLARQLKSACPQGIDVYFENVGGAVLRAVLPLLNTGARVPLCGLIAWYDGDVADGPKGAAELLSTFLVKQIKLQGFVILDQYPAHYGAFLKQMGAWLKEGQISLKEDVVHGLDQAPAAFMGMLKGRNFGKTVVRVADDVAAAR